VKEKSPKVLKVEVNANCSSNLGVLSTVDQVQWKDRISVNHEVTLIVNLLRISLSTVEDYGHASFIQEICKITEAGSHEGQSTEVMTVIHLIVRLKCDHRS
jgi:hypothetical protein